MKKQTRVWTTAIGEKIRICDMSDTHLLNTIQFLERQAEVNHTAALNSAYAMECGLQGEMALYVIGMEIRHLEEEGVDPYEQFPILHNLEAEKERRGLK